MKLFRAALFINLSRILEGIWFKATLSKSFLSWLVPGRVVDMQPGHTTGLLDILSLYEEDCLALGLTASVATIRRLRSALTKSHHDIAGIADLGQELSGRLFDEMNGRFFWSLSPLEAELYNTPRKGWEQIVDRFPDTISDIEEARRCLALSRFPAAVFHSLQVIEFGLIELGTFLQVNDPKSGWTAVAKALKNSVEKPHPERTQFEKDNRDFLEQMQGTVEALKNAWRNKVSHVQGKLVLMTRDFSPEVAEEILVATRAFMRRLATDMPNTTP